MCVIGLKLLKAFKRTWAAFRANEITGLELLALNMDGLKMIGINQTVLLKEINMHEKGYLGCCHPHRAQSILH